MTKQKRSERAKSCVSPPLFCACLRVWGEEGGLRMLRRKKRRGHGGGGNESNRAKQKKRTKRNEDIPLTRKHEPPVILLPNVLLQLLAETKHKKESEGQDSFTIRPLLHYTPCTDKKKKAHSRKLCVCTLCQWKGNFVAVTRSHPTKQENKKSYKKGVPDWTITRDETSTSMGVIVQGWYY
jgi:hypothetical protein